jgi:hypothetical protein
LELGDVGGLLDRKDWGEANLGDRQLQWRSG